MKTHIQFKYISDSQIEEKLDYKFENPIVIKYARTIEEVSELVHEAERYQKEGYYVVITLPYESAVAFDSSLDVYNASHHYGSIQVFEQPVSHFNDKTHHTYINEHIEWRRTDSDERLANNIHAIQDEIRLGNTYQVNYTTQLESEPIRHGYDYYQSLTEDANGDYQAYIELEDETIISISPELFFQYGPYQQMPNTVLTKPMKGTISRGNHKAEDQANYEQLKHSQKDRAENVMIVDLLRNDLSKISEVGTVNTIDLFKIEPYQTVYQMTSTIRSQLKAQQSLFNLLQALFPCGSITGAPKESTMAIIKRLENRPRGIYCGTIGLLLPDNRMIFNVPIRTIHSNSERAVYGVGAGITIDSNAEAEIEEFKMKSKILESRHVNLIETMRLENGIVQRRHEHTNRISTSAKALNIRFNKDEWDTMLNDMVNTYVDGTYKLRVELNSDGTFNNEASQIVDSNQSLTAQLLPSTPVSSIYTVHKTTERQHFQHNHDTDVILYYNEENEITEFDIGNVVIKIGDAYITPSYHGQFLNGCMRQALLKDNLIEEKNITVEKLINDIESLNCEIYMINSLREWTKIDLKL
ncbi:bifunctional anthranilate synthase component I family protein/class IV aminotransferase [Mammaliicoccus sciuri]|uniref:bifunctional anthranilate synthase component I family protein/class IV aminotransferase n=1 Tax=Mammaliicoccus sciuri TaxID=1296 RepID=UPI002DBC5712|nr:bifunctional anthranilate synthase component I family protein/class IV aminotransferase [Mammaliicoccus sciuri]MEB7065409.1 bifunctional anthranilate synthase component I family protein/class IV aminotransferase [Mammaliicoccus sciuri]